MLSINERLTLKASVECANRELRSEQNNEVLKNRLEERLGGRTRDVADHMSVGSRPSASFHVAPSPALRCGRCLSVTQ